MPRLIAAPTIIESAGRVNSGHAAVSVARMASPDTVHRDA